MATPTISIVILNYNTKDILLDCINSLLKVKDEVSFEIIVVDNGSTDDSVESVRNLNLQGVTLKTVLNNENLGFAKGNNQARNHCNGKYVLFLNSDTLVNPQTLAESVAYMENNPDIGILTCKQVLKNGQLDKDSRRSFPTPWVSLTHFSFLDRLFPKSPLFAKYWYSYKDENEVHDIDVAQGAFMLILRKLLDEVDWFSTDYFLDGEDIDLSWKIKQKGYRILYYPKVWIHHLKKQTKRLNKTFVGRGVDSMAIFYKKWMWNRYPFFLNWLVMGGINWIKLLRIIRTIIGR